jgi:hypothetical protein
MDCDRQHHTTHAQLQFMNYDTCYNEEMYVNEPTSKSREMRGDMTNLMIEGNKRESCCSTIMKAFAKNIAAGVGIC